MNSDEVVPDRVERDQKALFVSAITKLTPAIALTLDDDLAVLRAPFDSRVCTLRNLSGMSRD